jgi:hypothetical protein
VVKPFTATAAVASRIRELGISADDLADRAGLPRSAARHFGLWLAAALLLGRDRATWWPATASRWRRGSYLIASMGIASGEAEEQFFRLYSGGPSKLYQHTPDDFASFFGPLQLLPPGIVNARA